MKKGKKALLFFIMIMSMIMVSAIPSFAMSKTYKSVETSSTLRINNYSFEKTFTSATAPNYYNLTVRQNGVKYLVLKGIQSYVLTNGTYIYYSSYSSTPNSERYYSSVLYRHNLVTNKRKLIAKGYNLVAVGAYDNYVYYGVDNESDGVSLMGLNVTTGKSRPMYDCAGSIQISNKHVLVGTQAGDVANHPYYIFNIDATGKVKIASALSAIIIGDRVYYVLFDSKTTRYKLKVSNFDGTGKYTILPWSKNFPSFYEEMEAKVRVTTLKKAKNAKIK